MRLLMLSAYPKVKGPISGIAAMLSDSLAELGHSVVNAGWGRHSDNEGWVGRLTGRWRDISRVHRLLITDTTDIMVVHTSHDWASLSRDLLLLLATRRLCRAIVLQFHGSQPELLLARSRLPFIWATSALFRLADAALVLSTEEQRAWQRFYPAGRFYVVDNPYVARIDRTVPDLPTVVAAIPASAPVLLFAGRVIRSKGIFDLLAALARVPQAYGCHLVVAGSGADLDTVREEAEALGLAQRVVFTGYIGGAKLAAVYARALALVLPTYAEGFPTVISEAMSAGLPIITTPIRGAADHLEPGRHALFVPPRDPHALTSAITRLLGDPQLRQAMGEANREKVKDFLPANVARKYAERLEEIWRVVRC